MELKLPLLLDGDISHAYADKVGQDDCVQQWILDHRDEALALADAHAAAGADMLLTPTGGMNTLLALEQVWKLNAALVTLTGRAGGNRPVAGTIVSTGHLHEPFGPMPYTDLIDTYAEQAIELALAGADYLLLRDMRTLGDARAVVLGARQAERPVFVSVRLEGAQASASADMDPLAALLCLQELGVCAFGVYHPDPEALARILARLAPHARVPLMAGVPLDGRTAEELHRDCFELLAAGARVLFTGEGIGPEHTKVLRRLLDSFDYAAFSLPERPEDTPLLLTDETQVYYLEEDFTASEEIGCGLDMSEAILADEDQNTDALLFHVRSIDDAYRLGQNAHMAGKAVILLAESEEALEMALLYYRGRALVDSRSDVPPMTMKALAKGYGAIVR